MLVFNDISFGGPGVRTGHMQKNNILQESEKMFQRINISSCENEITRNGSSIYTRQTGLILSSNNAWNFLEYEYFYIPFGKKECWRLICSCSK
jgi:hypothetical protein